MNQKFVVATSGTQPSGDATSLDRTICIQAKRYKQTSTLGLSDIEGNIREAMRAAYTLDAYVAVVTKDVDQLRERTAAIEQETGLDIVVIESTDALSPLLALTVRHWSAIREFLPTLVANWDNWAEVLATDTDVQKRADDATEEIRQGIRSQTVLARLCQEKLDERFTSGDSHAHWFAGQHIALQQAVPRRTARSQLRTWWENSTCPNGVLQAEEGYGKSWTAAAFAMELSLQNQIVLWLESSQWAGLTSIEEILSHGMKSILPEGDPRLTAYTRKALRLWTSPLLVVLDGVNERGAMNSAQRIIRHYSIHSAHYAQRIRILFTTRPLEQRSEYDRGLWHTCQRIELLGFSDPEFREALERHAPTLQLNDIPPGVRPLAAIPRYFHLSIRLHDRLRNIGEVTKPLLLFADLLSKMESGAPEFQNLYLGADLRSAEEVLAHLAKNACAKIPSEWEVDHQHIRDCYPHLPEPLRELAEGKVILKQRPGRVVVNQGHVALGFALHLLHIAEENSSNDFGQLSDQIARSLEPNPEQDFRADSLYLALLLTCFREGVSTERSSRIRSALLLLWWTNHNANHDSHRLEFWSKEDPAAYLETVFSAFVERHSAPVEESLVAPLARRWRDGGSHADSIRPTLEKWLIFVYPETSVSDNEQEASERASFPHVPQPTLLRLSTVALSLLSQRPETKLLPALARCVYSQKFCMTRHQRGEHNYSASHKNIGGVIGVLLRIGFGEPIISEIEALATNTTDSRIAAGCISLASLCDLNEIPESLRVPQQSKVWKFRDSDRWDLHRGFVAWLAKLPNPDEHWPSSFQIGALAIYDDIPELSPCQAPALAHYLDELGDKRNALGNIERTSLEGYCELLPWLARCSPEAVQKVHENAWIHYLHSKSPDPIAWEPLIPISEATVREILDAIETNEDFAKKIQKADQFSVHFTTTVLISAREPEWLRWFDHLQRYPGEKYYAWEILPAAYVLAEIATPKFRVEIKKRFLNVVDRLGDDLVLPEQDVHWLRLLAISFPNFGTLKLSEDHPAYANWATEELSKLSLDDARIEPLLQIVAGSRRAGIVERMFQDPALIRFLETPDKAHVFGRFLRTTVDRKLTITYSSVSGRVPLNLARGILLMASSETDLVDYARAVVKTALRRVTQPSPRPPSGYVSEFGVSEKGDVVAWGISRSGNAHSHTRYANENPLWGVDMVSSEEWKEEWRARIEDPNKPDARLAQENITRRHQNERHQDLPDKFVVDFDGACALDAWAREFPAEYRAFVQKFVEVLYVDRWHLFDMGAFTYALLRPLCRIDPRFARTLYDDFFTNDVVNIYTWGGIPAFIADLWSHKFNEVAGIDDLRKATLDDCRHDLHVLWVTLASIAGLTQDKLNQQIDGLISSTLGKHRALAVTLLAFGNDPERISTLRTLQETDASNWVRRQAKWSLENLEKDLAAKRHWDLICTLDVDQEKDFETLVAELVMLGPVIPPSSLWWPSPRWETDQPRAAALLLAFRQEWKTHTPKKIGKRNLAEFYCGMELSRDVATRMAPWWTP